MTGYFDLSDVNMPDGIPCMDTIVSNKVNDSYELSLSLFETCQLNCKFCFQRHTRGIDVEYIRSIPDKALAICERLRKFNTKTLYIRLWGGELFFDSIDPEMFNVYNDLCETLVKKFKHEIPDLTIKFNFMTNGAWTKHRHEVETLLTNTHGAIGFSYDPVGRFATDAQRQMCINNIHHFFKFQGHVNVAMTTTRPNIECILRDGDEFLANFPRDYSFEINYYIPSEDWVDNMPDDDLIYRMWMHFLERDMFNCKSLNSYVEPIIYPGREVFSTCGCKCSDQFSNNCIVRDCISRTSRLPISEFYGYLAEELTDNNAQEIKNYAGVMKRGCLFCPNKDRCAWICFSSILFKHYKAECCPISRLIDYVDEHRNEVKSRYEAFKHAHDLDVIFHNTVKNG